MVENQESSDSVIAPLKPGNRWASFARFLFFVALGVFALWYRHHLMPVWRNALEQTADYVAALCLSAAAILLCELIGWRVPALPRMCVRWWYVFALAGLFAAVYWSGMQQFGGYDEGLVANAAAYYAQGDKPGVDYQSSMPPLFMAGIHLVQMTWGLRWAGFAALLAAFAVLTCSWSFLLFRAIGVQMRWAMALSACIQVCTSFVAPFWWYNNTSSLAVILLFLSVLVCLNESAHVFCWISLSVSLAMVLASKPNSLPACLMVASIFPVSSRRCKLKALASVGCALGIAYGICAVAAISPSVLFGAYAEVAKLRGSPLAMVAIEQQDQPERTYLVVLICFLLLITADLMIRRMPSTLEGWKRFSAVVVCVLVAIDMVLSNSEFPATNLVVLLVVVSLLCLFPWDSTISSESHRRLLAKLVIVFVVFSTYFGVTHVRILTIGEESFYEPLPTVRIDSGFFAGMQASPRLSRLQNEVAAVLQVHSARTVFFGPRIDFEYAAFHRHVPDGLPLSWATGHLYSEDRLPDFLAALRKGDPDLLVFLKDDYTRMGLVADYIQSSPDYWRIDQFQDLTVYVRKRH